MNFSDLPGFTVQSYGRPGTTGGAAVPIPKPVGTGFETGIVETGFEPPKDKSRFSDDNDEVP